MNVIFSIPGGLYTVVTYVLAGTVGLCVGSFLNVVIYRLPNGMSLARPASHCTSCGYKLKFYDNIPIVSYCLLGGRCRSCKQRISFRYTAVEAANTLLWLLCVLRFRTNAVYMAVAMLVCSVSLCIAFIDAEHQIIPDRLQIALAIPAVVAIFVDTNTVWYDHLIGAGAAFAVLLAVSVVGEKVLGREALGGGDVKLVTVCGLLLGWQKLILMMLIASIGGSIVMLAAKRKQGGESRDTPFAPFLTAGTVIAMLFGDAIISAYLGILIG